MALTADQTAVLELLLAGGQDFAELAELLDLEESEVRSRARDALTELGGADPDAHVALSEYLLGQADRIGRADAVRHLRQDSGDHALASKISEELRALAPGAELPELPPSPGGGVASRQSSSMPSLPSLPSLDTSRSRLIAILAGASVVLIFAVLGITGAFSGEDEPAGEAVAEGDAASSDGTTTNAEGEEVTTIPLAAVGNGDATGEGSVGITTGDQVYLDITLQGLDPAPSGQVYVVWFLFDDDNGYPLSPIAVNDDGSFEDRFAIPSIALDLVSRARFLNVSLAPIESVQGTIRSALREEQLVIKRPGTTVLQGEVPLPEGQEAPAIPEGTGSGSGQGGAGQGGQTPGQAQGN